MKEQDWKDYVANGGKNRVIADLASQHSGRAPTSMFTRYWFEDPDTGAKNFKERVKKLVGIKLYKQIIKNSDQ